MKCHKGVLILRILRLLAEQGNRVFALLSSAMLGNDFNQAFKTGVCIKYSAGAIAFTGKKTESETYSL